MTQQPALDRRTGAAVVLHRRPIDGDRGAAWATARRRAGIDHPALAPMVDAWLDRDELVIVELAVPGRSLADRRAEVRAWLPSRFVEEVLGPLAEALDALHAHGLAGVPLEPEAIVLTRSDTRTTFPVLVGGPGGGGSGGGDPASDRSQLAALAGCATPPGPVRSCGALVNQLAATAGQFGGELGGQVRDGVVPTTRARPRLRALVDRFRP